MECGWKGGMQCGRRHNVGYEDCLQQSVQTQSDFGPLTGGAIEAINAEDQTAQGYIR